MKTETGVIQLQTTATLESPESGRKVGFSSEAFGGSTSPSTP